MNPVVLHNEVQSYISANLKADTVSLLLKPQQFPGITQKELVEQIESKKKSAAKLPSWFAADHIYYPNKLHIEQSSSEVTASYKSALLPADRILDGTGGMGVDSYYFSLKAQLVDYCEQNATLWEITRYNLGRMGVENIRLHQEDVLDFLKNTDTHYDLIYLDPSRRSSSGKKIVFFRDCEPDFPGHQAAFWEAGRQIMLKASPMHDIKAGIKELDYLREVHVVAVKNEVKELLFVMEKGFSGEAGIIATELDKNAAFTIGFRFSDEDRSTPSYSGPLKYLYEPSAAILKAGCFNYLAKDTGTSKLHPHSHLYTSDKWITFPGRQFRVLDFFPYSGRFMRKAGITKANIATRNFPESVARIRKRWHIQDGGDDYLFFTTDPQGKPIVVICHKI